jgi:hypothetical protein
MSITGPKTALALCLLALVFLVACDEEGEERVTTSGVLEDADVVLSSRTCVCTRNGGDFIPDYCSNRADITFADLGINHESVKPASAKSYANPTALCKDASFNNHIISQTRVTEIARSDAKAYCKDQVLYIPNCGDAIHPNCESSANAELQSLNEQPVKDCAHPGVTFTEQAAGQASSTASSDSASSESASSESASSESASSESASSESASSESVVSLTDLGLDQAAEEASSDSASSDSASSDSASSEICATNPFFLASEAACCPADEMFDSGAGACISLLFSASSGSASSDSASSESASSDSEGALEDGDCSGQGADCGGAPD